MNQFDKLRTLRAFRSHHAEFFGTLEEHHLIVEIGYHQAKGKPLTLKQLFLLDIGSVSTVQRSLRRLKERGLVKHRPAASDRRAIELTLSPKCVRVFAKYDSVMNSKLPGRRGARGKVESRHLCGLCDSDAGSQYLLGTFLAEGLKRGDKCVLVAPVEAQEDIISEVRGRSKATERLIVSEGHHSTDAHFAFFHRVFKEAKQAGQAICVAANMAWTFSRNVRIDALLDNETRLDALAGHLPLTALCVYDARRFSSSAFLQVVKCHSDHSRHPIAVG